jgi:CubicO group peptidase (beta-lactamase class C family)
MTKHNDRQPSRRSVLTALAATPLLATANATAEAAGDTTGSIPGDLRPGGKLDQLIAQLAAEDKFSGTVLLTYKNKPVLCRSHQMADKARAIPNGPDTIFDLGSITKMFTGVAIAQLAQQGKIAFGGKLGTYVDGFTPEIAGTVRIHHLLTHSSGLGDYHSPEYFQQAKSWDTVEKVWDGTMGFVKNLGLGFTPGGGQLYSNAGCVILGAIVAKVSGQSYYDYVREHIFRPAGMTSSGYYTRPELLANRRAAHPYATSATGERVDTLDDSLFVSLPPGGSRSSAPDLVRFANAFQANKLLSPAVTHLISSPKIPLAPDNSFFNAYSIGAHLTNGQWSYGHNGGSSQGVSANLEWFPDSGWVAVVLANYVPPAAEPIARMARDLITRAQ